jgi:dTDP-glucose 4,6-dehydratase
LFEQLWTFSFPEKLIPLFINNIIQNKPLPVYGDGKYTRDWLFVEDHAVAIDLVFIKGQIMIRIMEVLTNGKT